MKNNLHSKIGSKMNFSVITISVLALFSAFYLNACELFEVKNNSDNEITIEQRYKSLTIGSKQHIQKIDNRKIENYQLVHPGDSWLIAKENSDHDFLVRVDFVGVTWEQIADDMRNDRYDRDLGNLPIEINVYRFEKESNKLEKIRSGIRLAKDPRHKLKICLELSKPEKLFFKIIF